MRKFSFPMFDLKSYERSVEGGWGQNAHIKSKTITLQEQSQVRIFSKDRVVGNLLYAFFQCQSPLPHKLIVEPTEGVLVRDRGYHHARIVIRQSFVKPKEVGVTPEN